jgi:succinyl-CoA synthetase beta subunit
MRLLAYESKEILKKHCIPVPEAQIVSSAGQIAFDKLVMVKAQMPIGGRGPGRFVCGRGKSRR